jgi:hypothetical protein
MFMREKTTFLWVTANNVCANFALNQDLKICVLPKNFSNPRDLKYFYESKRYFYPCVEMDLKSKFIYELTRVKGIISTWRRFRKKRNERSVSALRAALLLALVIPPL